MTETEPTEPVTLEQVLALARRLTPEQKATILAESFHVLVGVPGVRPFNAEALNRAARSMTNAERQAALFVLEVYNHNVKWSAGRFNVAYAMAIWDDRNRAAFQLWAANPFTL